MRKFEVYNPAFTSGGVCVWKDKGMRSDSSKVILISDDSFINREILRDMLEDEYELIEAQDGEETIEILEQKKNEINILLLDLVMPKKNGYDVLEYMNSSGLIETIPVIMISSESDAEFITKAYSYGAMDYITRPFHREVVRQRILNMLMLYAKQSRLVDLVAEQVFEKEKNLDIMISVLSNIVEFRNGESGLHVQHINTLTECMLRKVQQLYPEYGLEESQIALIATASSLHDVGKLQIPDEILNKPGRLTDEEYNTMKQHSRLGYEMLGMVEYIQEEPIIKYARDIARWHHERFDGRGYPDGLKGEEIPIWAQAVSVADVYDALTSKRVYKPAYTHEKAMDMIRNGECGAFNPKLMEALELSQDEIQEVWRFDNVSKVTGARIKAVTKELLDNADVNVREDMILDIGGPDRLAQKSEKKEEE